MGQNALKEFHIKLEFRDRSGREKYQIWIICLIHNQILNSGFCDHDPITSTSSQTNCIQLSWIAMWLCHMFVSSLMLISGPLRQLPERSVDSAMQGTSEQCWNSFFHCHHWELVGLHPRKVTWKLKMSLFDKESFTTQRFWTGCSFLGVTFGGNVSFVNSCLKYGIFKTAMAQNRPQHWTSKSQKVHILQNGTMFQTGFQNHNHSCQAFFSELKKSTGSFGCFAFG